MSAGGHDSREEILHGPIPATLFGIAWPMTAMLLLDNGQNFLVALWAGRLIGGDSLTALAVMSPLLTLLALLTGTIHIGVQILVARATGRGDREAALLLSNGLYLGLAWGLLVTFVGLSQLDTLVTTLAGDLTIASSLTSYFTPWLAFFAVPVATGVVVFAVNATGWTRFGLARSIISLLAMLAFMPAFIQVLDLGLTGVALSDGFSDLLLLVLCALAIYSARKTAKVVPGRGEWRVDLGLWRKIIAAGLPYQLARGMMILLQIAMIRVLMTTGDADLVAGYGLNQVLVGFFISIGGGAIASAAGIVIGQNVAAGKLDRATACLRVAATWLAAYGVVLLVLSSFFEPLYGIFTDDAATIAHADTVIGSIKWMFPASLVSGLLLRANAAIARNRIGNLVSIGCSCLALVALLTLPWSPFERVTTVLVWNNYAQVAALSVLVVRSLRNASRSS